MRISDWSSDVCSSDRLLINHWRRRQIEQAYLDALALQPEPVAPSPESQALIVETLLQVDAMLAQLSAKVRSAFLMSQLQRSQERRVGTECVSTCGSRL